MTVKLIEVIIINVLIPLMILFLIIKNLNKITKMSLIDYKFKNCFTYKFYSIHTDREYYLIGNYNFKKDQISLSYNDAENHRALIGEHFNNYEELKNSIGRQFPQDFHFIKEKLSEIEILGNITHIKLTALGKGLFRKDATL